MTYEQTKTRGTQLWIGTQAADHLTDTYQQVPGSVQIQGQIGPAWGEMNTTELGDVDDQIDKATRNRGRLTFVGNYRENDLTGGAPGLVALEAAADHDTVVPYNVMLVKSNGRRKYLKCGIQSFQHTFGSGNNMLGYTSLCIVKAAPPEQPPAVVAAPTNTVLPGISGLAVEGGTAIALPGIWTGNPAFGYQWQRDDEGWEDIVGAVNPNYEFVEADVGHQVRYGLTGTNAGGSLTVYSAPTAIVAEA